MAHTSVSAAPPCGRARLLDEAPTLALLVFAYAAWAGLALASPPLIVSVPALALVLTLHSSLQHELLHGHPFDDPGWNLPLAWAPLGLAVPYQRFRDLHIRHHVDTRLTDPYDDPETHYLDPAVWARLSPGMRTVLRANNTLLGRVALGPVIGMAAFWADEARLVLGGDVRVGRIWAAHLLGATGVLWAVSAAGTMPLWAYAAAAYAALGVLHVRTFLEHRAEAAAESRTVIIEDRGLLALLFLNNNFHAVHHAHPKAPWWRLPALYADDRAGWLARNGGYRYRSYGEVARRHLVTPKDPVPHPFGRAP